MLANNRIAPNANLSSSIPSIVMNCAMESDKINICHLNVQSMCARNLSKLEEFKICFTNSKSNIICVTETWLTENIEDNLISIDGYQLIRHDRNQQTRGGGICVYFKAGINCRIVSSSKNDTNNITEFLFLETEIGGEKFLLGVFYNPPRVDCSTVLSQQLIDHSLRYNKIILIGDFNTDIKKSCPQTQNFLNVTDTFGLSCVNTIPTHFHYGGSSTIDLLLTNDPDFVLKFNQVSAACFSRHDIIFSTLDLNTTKTESCSFFRNYNKINVPALNHAVTSINWNLLYSMTDSNIALDFFNVRIKQLFEHFVPLCKFQTKQNPWFNNDILKAMIERDLAYGLWKADRSTLRFDEFKRLRNRVTTLINFAKSKYVSDRVSNADSSKSLWKKLKDVNVKSKQQRSEQFLNSSNEINNHFSSNFTQENSPPCTLLPNLNGFKFSCISDAEVILALSTVKSDAVGLDEIPLKFIKLILPLILDKITYIFNLVITTSKFPRAWKSAKIIPIKKKPRSLALDNLRPISVLSALSKVFEKILKTQMQTYLTDFDHLYEFQSGFRSKHSTTTALLKVHDDLLKKIDRKGVAFLLFIDFSKAFDRVSHSKLIQKLSVKYNFSIEASKLIQSYLTGRTQFVFSNGVISNPVAIMSGVPQGSILGPILFSLFINDLPSVLENCKMHIFADDVQLYLSSNCQPVAEMGRLLNEDLCKILRWSNRNLLPINASKTKVMFISRNRRNASLPQICLGQNVIEYVTSALNLGFIMQNNLEWDRHINGQCRKIYNGLRHLKITSSMLPVQTKLKLFKSLLLPHFMYGDVLLLNASANSLNKLCVALNACIRYIYNLSRYARVSHLQHNLLGCSFNNFFKLRSCLTLFKIINTSTPRYLSEKLQISRSTRTRNFIIPMHRTSHYNESFFVRGVAIWNQLPVVIKNIHSPITFRKECINWFGIRN